MAGETVCELPVGGFNFENCLRNTYFASKGYSAPQAKKTGTTIVGIIFKDGVILGADTRATSDVTVMEKNCSKIHYVTPNIYCCGAGTSGDIIMVTKKLSSQLSLHRLDTDRIVPVRAASQILRQHLFRYQGYIGAALIIGGMDSDGPSLYNVSPHGAGHTFPYLTMGSGMLAAMSVFEKDWKPDMSLEEGKLLVRNAVAAGALNDLGSGNNISMCVITKEGAKHVQNYEILAKKGDMQSNYRYQRGNTAVLSTQVIPLEVVEVTVKPVDEEMDVSG